MDSKLEKKIGEFLKTLYTLQDEQSLSDSILSGLSSLIPSDNVIVGRHSPASREALQLRLLRPFSSKSFLEALGQSGAALDHPIWQPVAGDPFGVKCLSSMMTRSEWESHPLYCEFLRDDGVHDHLTLDLPNPGGVYTMIGVIRSRRGFSKEESALLRLLGPHFGRAFHNSELYQSTGSLREVNGKMPSVCYHGPFRNSLELKEWVRARWTFWRTVLIGFDRVLVESGFLAWGTCQMDWLSRGGLDRGLEKLRLEGGGGVIQLNMARNWNGRGVFLLESQFSTQAAINTFRLTKRESELAHWLREGKTDPEIAIILGLSLYTVKGYLKSLYRKMGVRSRTEAAFMVDRGSF